MKEDLTTIVRKIADAIPSLDILVHWDALVGCPHTVRENPAVAESFGYKVVHIVSRAYHPAVSLNANRRSIKDALITFRGKQVGDYGDGPLFRHWLTCAIDAV